MVPVIKRKIKILFLRNSRLLILNFCIFCFLCGLNLSEAINRRISATEFTLLSVADHYYILYCLLPIVLVLITGLVTREENEQKIRYKSHLHLLRLDVISFFLWLALYMVIHVVISFGLGLLNLETLTGFTQSLSETQGDFIELKTSFASFFREPWQALLAVIFYYCIGFSFLLTIIKKASEKYELKAFPVIGVVLTSTIIGFKTPLSQWFPLMAFNNYILLHHVLLAGGIYRFITITCIMAVGFSLMLGVKPKPLAKTSLLEELSLSRKIRRGCILGILAIIGLEYIRAFYEGGVGGIDLFFRLFLGSSRDNPSFIGAMRLIVITFLPIFSIGVSQAKLKQYHELPVWIRYGSMEKLNWKILKSYTKFMGSYVLLFAGFFALCSLFSGDFKEAQYLEEIFHGEITFLFLWKYYGDFVLRMYFTMVVFLLLSKKIGEIGSFMALVVFAFATVSFPSLHGISLWRGIFSYLEGMQRAGIQRYVISGTMGIITIIYYIYKRRKMDVSDKAYRRFKRVS